MKTITILIFLSSCFFFFGFSSAQEDLVQVFLNGGNNTGTEPSAFVNILPYKQSGSLVDFLREVESRLPDIFRVCALSEVNTCIPESINFYNWRRVKISSTAQLTAGDLLFIVPWNESFIWPGLYIGHKVSLELPVNTNGVRTYRKVEVQTTSLTPRAFIIEEFLTDEECQAVIEVGSPSLFSSTIGEEGKLSTGERNSETAWMYGTDPRVKTLFDRASFLTHTPIEHQEALQLLHYRVGGFYNSHCDYFGDPGCAEKASRINRFITLLFYLSEVEGGGGTTFWRVKGENDTDDPWVRHTADVSCNGGLVSTPKKRKALMFYNLFPMNYRTDPRGDRMSEHTACNVTAGEKWAANFWVWNNLRSGDPDRPEFYSRLNDDFLVSAEFGQEPNQGEAQETFGQASPDLVKAATDDITNRPLA